MHAVTLTHPFWMQKTLVTQAQWQTVMGTNPSGHHDCPQPAETVSRNDVQEFLRRLNGRFPKYIIVCRPRRNGNAARAGTNGDYGVPGPATAGGGFGTTVGQ